MNQYRRLGRTFRFLRSRRVIIIGIFLFIGGPSIHIFASIATRFLWEGKNVIYSNEAVPFFGANSADDAIRSMLSYWIDNPMLCFGLWDGKTRAIEDVPDWVESNYPDIGKSLWISPWIEDSAIEVIQREKIDSNMWYIVAEGRDNYGEIHKISCLVYKEWFGRWKIHDPELRPQIIRRAEQVDG
jgi:hypothetical protein